MTERQKNEVQLGDPKVFVLETRNGIAESVRADVTLSKDDKEFCYIYKRPVITAKGYNKLNQVSAITILSPPMIGDRANPIVETDDIGSPTRVTVRKIAVGYSPIGSICIIDETVNFDINSYLRQEVFKAWEKFQNIGELVTKPSEPIAQKMFIPIIGSNGILLDMYHEEAKNLIASYLQRQKYAARIAGSIARRNCLKAHPAIATTTCKFLNNKAYVTVYGFKLGMTKSQVVDLAEAASNGETIDNVELIAQKSTAQSEDVNTEYSDVGDPSLDGDDSNSSDEIDIIDDKTSVLEKIINYRKVIGGDKFDEVVPENIFDMSEKEQKEILNIVGKEVLKVASKRID